MKSSNLALRLDDEEAQVDGTTEEPGARAISSESGAPIDRRPRRSLEFRSIVINDQGFAPFRVR
jgi:hypothetical protein